MTNLMTDLAAIDLVENRFTFDNDQITTLIGALEVALMEHCRCSVKATREGHDELVHLFSRQAVKIAKLIDQLKKGVYKKSAPS